MRCAIRSAQLFPRRSAQAWRGGPQHNLSRLLRGCDIAPMTEEMARQSGRACALAGTCDVVDAAVVALGLARNDLAS
jgi:hypothetical protein